MAVRRRVPGVSDACPGSLPTDSATPSEPYNLGKANVSQLPVLWVVVKSKHLAAAASKIQRGFA
jgi:hypothetical protein